MPKRYYEQDGSLTPLKGKTIAIIGYGSQGHAHALNLRDSGLQVVVGLHAGSKSKGKAEAAGLRVLSVGEATKTADFIMVLLPDHLQGEVYRNDIAPNLAAGKTLMFAHGFNIHFNEIKPPSDIDVSMIAPKAPGHRVRELFVEGVGVHLGQPGSVSWMFQTKGQILVERSENMDDLELAAIDAGADDVRVRALQVVGKLRLVTVRRYAAAVVAARGGVHAEHRSAVG